MALDFLLLCQCSPAQRAPWWHSCDVQFFLHSLCRLQAPAESVFRVWEVCLSVCACVLDCGLGLVHKTQLTAWGLGAQGFHPGGGLDIPCNIYCVAVAGAVAAAVASECQCWWWVSSGCAWPPPPCGMLGLGMLSLLCSCLLSVVVHRSQQVYKLLDVILMHPVSLKIRTIVYGLPWELNGRSSSFQLRQSDCSLPHSEGNTAAYRSVSMRAGASCVMAPAKVLLPSVF